MIFLYLLIGALVWTSYDVMPGDVLAELQSDPTRSPRRRDIAAAVAMCVITLAVWPLAVFFRASSAVRRRLAASWAEENNRRAIPTIPGQRQPAEPIKAPIPAPRQP
ncbi:hypothetical protein OHS71_41015 (plasmid) [Streptomyces sp. NBC_00377]|uniref:hypothetical protein n=1 Tax=unclassified Streptomyces TaxID=2593676 RepID=UPI002E1DEA01|nr:MULTISPECIES: hypothetical protein [unclassified Streptomyces]